MSIHTFRNGFRIVYQRSEQELPITSLQVFCNVGSAYEQDGIRGASHFVEHMCFKGTKSISTKKLLIHYNKAGAYLNAYTDKRNTVYLIKCDDEFVAHAVTMMAEMLLHSSFPRKEYNKEQHVVVEENIRAKDNDNTVMTDAIERILFSGSSYQYPVDDISYHPRATTLKYETMVEWYKWFYRPSQMILSVVSRIPFRTILSHLSTTAFVHAEQEECAPLHARSYPLLTLSPMSTTGTCRIETIHKKGIAATILTFSFRTCSRFSIDRHRFTLLQFILNGFSGRLFTAFRTQQGLTYRSECNTTYAEHTGYLSVYLQTDPLTLFHGHGRGQEGVLPIMIRLLNDMKQKGVTQEEVQLAKGKIKGTMLLNRESIDTIARYNGEEAVFHDSFVPYQEIYSRYIAPITVSQMNRMIKKYFTPDNLLIGIMHASPLSRTQLEEQCRQFQ